MQASPSPQDITCSSLSLVNLSHLALSLLKRLPHDQHCSLLCLPVLVLGWLARLLLLFCCLLVILGRVARLGSALQPGVVHIQADTRPEYCSSHTGEERSKSGPKLGRVAFTGKQPRIGAEIKVFSILDVNYFVT